jgi:thioredoxin reductase
MREAQQTAMLTDVFVVGAGPAGLGAAIEAAKAGADVLVVDENRSPGGQLYKQIHKFFGSGAHYAGMRGFEIADLLLKEAVGLGVRIWLDTRALGLLDEGETAILKDGKTGTVKAKRTVLAAGAKENGLAFPGWTLPGVMTAGCAQTFSNIHRQLVGKRVFIAGSGNVGLIVAYQLLQAGAEIRGLAEIMSAVSGYQVHAGKIRRAGVPVYLSHSIREVRGNGRVEEVVIAGVDKNFHFIPSTEKKVDADTVLLAVGLSPRTELAAMFKCKMAYEGRLGGIMPIHDAFMRSSACRVYVCGDLAGVEEASTALDEGRLAGLHAAVSLGLGGAEAEGRLRLLRESLEKLRDGKHGRARRECKERICRLGAAGGDYAG